MESVLVSLLDGEIVIPKKMFNSMPNEMLRKIFTKLKVQKLICLRRVCTKWMGLAEDICREKRSLLIWDDFSHVSPFFWSEVFNHSVDFAKNGAVLKVKTKFLSSDTIFRSKDFSNYLAKLFPHVENLVFKVSYHYSTDTAENLFTLLANWSSTLVTLNLPGDYCFPESHHNELSNHVNNLTALKRLDFPSIEILNPSTIGQLDHYTLHIRCAFDKFHYLRPSCITSLYLFGNVSLAHITQLPKHNAQLVKGLTHLRLETDKLEVLEFVCSNFGALQWLNVRFVNILDRQLFKADSFTHLARLSNLSQLTISYINFHLPTLERANLTPLISIRILTLSNIIFERIQFDGDQFGRVMASIFPNLQELIFKCPNGRVCDEIAQHLDHFVHLLKHRITSCPDN